MKKGFMDFVRNNLLLFDGAMGTELYNRGIFINRSYDELNLSSPRLIQDIHLAYINAGADVIETNTFGANRLKLKKHGLEDKVAAINESGAAIAGEAAAAAGGNVYVAGAIGPLEERLEPWGSLSEQEARDIFLEQAEPLVKGGVDLFILETFFDLHMIQQALTALKERFDLPVIAQMTIDDDGNSLFGTAPETFAPRLVQWGADAVGINCSVGPKVMLETLERIVAVVDVPISVMPNAGMPQNVEGRNIYLASAAYFGEYALRFVKAGARIIGGCCGTTPDFIREMRKAIQSVQPKAPPRLAITSVQESECEPAIAPEEKSRFAGKIVGGEFVTTVEIVPPKGSDAGKQIDQARKLKSSGVDAINIPDGPRALSRMGASYLSLMIQQQAGIEVIQHYACRDRNLLGMVGDLLGAYGIGIHNLLIITGDPPKMGTYPDATAVFDVDSIGLTNVAYSLNCARDLGGNPLKRPTGFFIGVGVNPGAIDLDYEIRRFEWKVKAGAEFAVTQPVFDIRLFQCFLKRIEHIKIPLLAGIWPLVSIRNAEFMNNEVPGASVPETIMKRLHATGTKEEARQVGIQIAREILRELKSHIAGVQVSMPFGNLDYPLDVLQEVL